MLNINEIVLLQARNISDWHLNIFNYQQNLPLKYVEENNYWNFQLWHEEDIARIKDIDPLRIVEAKRKIDHYNQQRNNSMEKIDEWILNYLNVNNIIMEGNLHSETPGMMIDRLSIMTLKKYHMLEEVFRENASEEHRLKCKERVSILEDQIFDLSSCLSEVTERIEKGELKFKVYRQLKMYNDPNLNPELYKRTNL